MRDNLLQQEPPAGRFRDVRRLAVALALSALLAGCSGGTVAAPPPASTTGPPPTPTSSTTETSTTPSTSLGFDKPATVDVAYVQRVVDEIYRLEGDAARHLYANKVPDAEFNDRLEAIFGDPELSDAKTSFGRDAAQGLSNFAEPPGDPSVKVLSILDSTPDCIVVRATLNFTALYKRTAPASPTVLIQLLAGNAEPFNPVPWGVVAAGPPSSTTDPKVC